MIQGACSPLAPPLPSEHSQDWSRTNDRLVRCNTELYRGIGLLAYTVRRATKHFVRGGKREIFCAKCSPLNISRGGGGKKNVYYTQKIKTLTKKPFIKKSWFYTKKKIFPWHITQYLRWTCRINLIVVLQNIDWTKI